MEAAPSSFRLRTTRICGVDSHQKIFVPRGTDSDGLTDGSEDKSFQSALYAEHVTLNAIHDGLSGLLIGRRVRPRQLRNHWVS